MSPWLARRWYDVVFWTCFLLFGFFFSLRVRGRRNVPRRGPVLVLSNHQSFMDPVLNGLSVPRYLAYLARETLFKNKYFKALIESLDAIPIDHKGLGKDGLQATLDALKRGKAVIVYPEGERTHDGAVAPFKAGISLLLKKVEAPIVPIGIAGAFEAWPRHRKFPRFAPLFAPPSDASIAVSIGKPIDPATLVGLSREEMLQRLAEAVDREFQKAQKLKRQKRGS